MAKKKQGLSKEELIQQINAELKRPTLHEGALAHIKRFVEDKAMHPFDTYHFVAVDQFSKGMAEKTVAIAEIIRGIQYDITSENLAKLQKALADLEKIDNAIDDFILEYHKEARGKKRLIKEELKKIRKKRGLTENPQQQQVPQD